MTEHSIEHAFAKPVWEQVAMKISDQRDRFYMLLLAGVIVACVCGLWLGSGVLPLALALLGLAIWNRPCKPHGVIPANWIAKQSEPVREWLKALVPQEADGLLRFGDIDSATQPHYAERLSRNVRDNRARAVAEQRGDIDH